MSTSGEIARPTRVLVVAPSMDIVGGQSVQGKYLLEYLRREQSVAVEFLPQNPRLPGVLRILQRVRYLRTIVTSLAYVVLLLRRIPRQDVVHIFAASYFSFLLAPTPAILIARLFGKKIVLNYHSGEAEHHLLTWRHSALATLRLADRIVVASDYLVDVFAKFGLEAHPISNVIDVDRFPRRGARVIRPLFLTNRNHLPMYNVACVLRAFALIQRECPDARLLVAGNGKERPALERLSRSLGLRNTEFLGTVRPEDSASVYGAADIYLNGSNVDNMPCSILEAFASGLPVITTDAGGIPNIVSHDVTGILVPRGDAPAMATAALRLLSNPALASDLVTTAQRQVTGYTWPKVRVQWLSLYAELAAREARGDVHRFASPEVLRDSGVELPTLASARASATGTSRVVSHR